MADTKITALAAIGANPINVATFPIPMVDLLDNSMAASGTTKKVTVNQILGAGGTATLASATITGDLTVATNTLKTTSGNVGIGTVTPDIFSRFYTRTIGFNSTGSSVMQINGTSYGGIDIGAAGTRTFSLTASGTDINFGSLTNIPVVFNINGSDAMRLNSTGLGVGASPTSKLTIGTAAYAAGTLSGTSSLYSTVAQGLCVLADGFNVYTRTGGDRFILDSSGNVGIGISTFGTSAANVLGLADATAPTTSPAGMGQLYVEAGALKYRGSSGTVTTLANA